MKIYIKNTDTNEIKILEAESYESLSKNFRQAPYVKVDQSDINAFDLQEAKTSKLSQLDKNRNGFCLIPIEFEGNTFATTSEAKTAIISLANSLSTLETVVGYPSYPEDDLISLTKANFKSIETLIQTREFTSRETRRDLKTEINICTTIAEVESINITF